MKTPFANLLTLSALILPLTASLAHERITIGPSGGRVIYLDSPTVPNVEFKVNEEGRAAVTLLDSARKPIAPTEHTITVNAGPRASARKLAVEKVGDSFVSEKVPEGAPYTVVIQIKEKPDAKAITARINYTPAPAKSGKPTYLDDSVNEGSGPNLKVPESLEEHWAEINGHHGELTENFAKKAYEPLDEVTAAFNVLITALPEKSGDKKEAVAQQVGALVKEIDAIAQANATRELPKAAQALTKVNTGIAELKKNFPEKVANAKP
jgi:hypothetical protein